MTAVTPLTWNLFAQLSESEILQPATNFFRAIELTALVTHVNPKGTLLDHGCGNGSVTAVLTRYWKEIDTMIGVDVNSQRLSQARSLGFYSALKLANGSTLPLPDSTVDVVLSNSVIEHIPDLDLALREIRRVLTKTGTALFTIPIAELTGMLAGSRFPATMYMSKAREDYTKEFYHRIAFINVFSEQEWMEIFARNGFTVEHAIPYMNESQTKLWEYWSNCTGGLALALHQRAHPSTLAAMEDIQDSHSITRKRNLLSRLVNKMFSIAFWRALGCESGKRYSCRLFIVRNSESS